MGGISPLTFVGVSQFSSDFQTILRRAVSIASLPIRLMQNEQADVLARSQLLSDLRVDVAELEASLSALGGLGSTKAVGVSSSNLLKISASVTGETAPGVYTFSEITSVAKAASETTGAGYESSDATAVSATGTMELVFGAQTYALDLTGRNHLNGLREAIQDLGIGLNASVINTGSGSEPYFLLVSATGTGATTLQLRNSPGQPATNILTSDNQGADAVFKLNGLPVTRSGNTISDLVGGLAFTIAGTTAAEETVSVTVSSSRDKVSAALDRLVKAYNAVAGKVNAQIGEGAGLLSGDLVIRQIQGELRALAGYRSAGGAIQSLADLGIEFDDKGVMSLETAKWNSLSSTAFQDALVFLGSSTTGLGGLAGGFRQISDPVSGFIQIQQNQYHLTDQRLQEKIDEATERVDNLEISLSERLQQADALLARLESQQSLLRASLDAMSFAVFGKRES